MWNLVNKGRIYEEMIQLPQVLALHEHLLGDDCILSSFTVNLIGPGAPAGGLHVDFPLGRFPQPPPPFAFCSNTIFVLDDFTLDNGATRLVPGSYKRGHTPDPEAAYDDVIQLDACKGDIVIIHGATWHSSGANRTREERMILLGFYCRLVHEAAAGPVQAGKPRGRRAGDADPEAPAGIRGAVGHADVSTRT